MEPKIIKKKKKISAVEPQFRQSHQNIPRNKA